MATPFVDFYINCYLNNLMSLLVSLDESYRSFAYENNYYYYITDDMGQNMQDFSNSFEYIMLESFVEPYIEVYNLLFGKKIKPVHGMDFPPLGTVEYNFRGTVDFFQNAVPLLDSNYIIFVAVNLFFYIPKSNFYKKIHRSHYSMIVSYDSDNFLVFDEGPFGYKEYIVDKDVMKVAIEQSSLNPKVFLYKINSSIPKYKPNIERLINNAYKICNNINNVDLYLPSYKEANGYVDGLNRIMNRQKGNTLLFLDLSAKGIISNSCADELCNMSNDLLKKWTIARNRAVKEKVTGAQPNGKFIDNARQLLSEELGLWRGFINKMGG